MSLEVVLYGRVKTNGYTDGAIFEIEEKRRKFAKRCKEVSKTRWNSKIYAISPDIAYSVSTNMSIYARS